MTVKTDEPLSIIRQLELMRDLQRLANERAQSELRTRTALEDGLRDAAQRRDALVHEAEDRNSMGRVNAQIEYEAARQAVQQRYESDRDAAQQQYKTLRNDVESAHTQQLRAATTEKQERSWESQAMYEAIKGRPREEQLETEKRLNAIRAELGVLERDATAIMKMRRQGHELPTVDVQRYGAASRRSPHAGAARARRRRLRGFPRQRPRCRGPRRGAQALQAMAAEIIRRRVRTRTIPIVLGRCGSAIWPTVWLAPMAVVAAGECAPPRQSRRCCSRSLFFPARAG